MSSERKIITAADMDKMTPQQRADAVRASVVTNLEDLDPAFRERVERRAKELAQSLGTDA